MKKDAIYAAGPWAPASQVVFDDENYGAIFLVKYKAVICTSTSPGGKLRCELEEDHSGMHQCGRTYWKPGLMIVVSDWEPFEPGLMIQREEAHQ